MSECHQMKKRFKWKRAIIVFCIIMVLNLALNFADYSNLPRFVFYLAYSIDYPSIWLNVLFAKIPLSGDDHAGFQFLAACISGGFSAFIWAILAGFIFRRKPIAGKPADSTK